MNKSRILILDDEQDILNVIEKFFNRKKLFDIVTYNNPKKALKAMSNSKIDVLLTDIMMPEINGVEILKQVKRDYPDIKVIMMTAFSTLDKVLECEKLGANDYITKPFISLKDVEGKVLDQLGM